MSVGEVNPEGEPYFFTFDIAALGLAPGTYYLGAITDTDGIIAEGDEENNATSPGDVITIHVLPPTVFGSPGGDPLNGTGFFDRIHGLGGADTITGFAGNDTLDGGDGDDELFGGSGNDSLLGGLGRDHLFGGNNSDRLRGRLDRDTLDGGNGDDRLEGGKGRDRLEGGAGDDVLFGQNNNDNLFGNAGDDTLIGGTGNDRLTGGKNADTFIFEDGFGNDTILDFAATNNSEVIDLRNVTSITSYADLTNIANPHMTQVGAHVVIDDFAGNTITLLNTSIGDLDINDFVF